MTFRNFRKYVFKNKRNFIRYFFNKPDSSAILHIPSHKAITGNIFTTNEKALEALSNMVVFKVSNSPLEKQYIIPININKPHILFTT